MADPLVETATDAAEAVEGEMRKLFRLRGITLCDVEILEAMDKGEERLACCRHVPAEKRRTAQGRPSALTLPQMKALMEHARRDGRGAGGQEMMDGKTDICPVRDGGQLRYCSRCDYQSGMPF